MKRTYKIISTISIALFGVSLLLNWFGVFQNYMPQESNALFVIIYLVASLKYFRLELKEKNAKIQGLESKLKEKNHS